MNQDQTNQNNLLDTTDCLEAMGVFRGWKNFLFIVIIFCLLVLQVSFWLIDTGCVKADTCAQIAPSAQASQAIPEPNEAVLDKATVEQVKIQQAAKKAVAGPNQPSEAAPQQQPQRNILGFRLKIEHLTWLIRFFNFVLIPAAILYCLTILFSLKVSLLGRLGGINHISRAFFLSLLLVVFLLPWQRLFSGVVAGAMYTPEELLCRCAATDTSGIFGIFFYYLRFTGYWLLIVLLLILSQFRSGRWTKTILRRLEVI